MNRLNGAKCLVSSKDGTYTGTYYCVISKEESPGIENLMSNSLGNIKKVTIIVKDIGKSLTDCKLTILNRVSEKCYAINDYEVKLAEIDNKDSYFYDDEKNIISKIKEITSEEYQKLIVSGTSSIVWDKIKTSINGEVISKDSRDDDQDDGPQRRGEALQRRGGTVHHRHLPHEKRFHNCNDQCAQTSIVSGQLQPCQRHDQPDNRQHGQYAHEYGFHHSDSAPLIRCLLCFHE